MKTFLLSLGVAVLTSVPYVSWGTEVKEKKESGKILIAYYSLSGNTKMVADSIQKITGGTLFEILTVNDYPKKYDDLVAQAQKEIALGFKPKLKTQVKNIEQYDVVFIGSPNWWNTIAPPVCTFLSSYDLKGKKIVPFITHEGSRAGKTFNDIKKLAPQSIVFEPFAVRGREVKKSEKDITAWVKKILKNH